MTPCSIWWLTPGKDTHGSSRISHRSPLRCSHRARHTGSLLTANLTGCIHREETRLQQIATRLPSLLALVHTRQSHRIEQIANRLKVAGANSPRKTATSPAADRENHRRGLSCTYPAARLQHHPMRWSCGVQCHIASRWCSAHH